MTDTRLFFCTDLHGSEICFKKFLSAGKVYEVNTVIMGGDCTGKMVIPVITNGDGVFRCSWSEGDFELHSEEEVAELETQIKNNGLYPVRMTAEERAALAEDSDRLAELFRRVMKDTLRGWLALAEDRLDGTGIRVILTPGNDDEFEIDDVIGESEFVEGAEGKITRIGDHEMLSLGWSNETPWDTPRECSEPELAEKIAALADQIEDMGTAIFNIHVPPFGTGLDNAPELEGGDKLKRGGSIMKPVGSTAVREAILRHQPLLSLHGHIHESRGVQKLGRTTCVNPGSSYSDWALQGVIVDLGENEVTRYVPTTG